MHNVMKQSGKERIFNNAHSDRHLTDRVIFKEDLTIFAQNASNFINIFTGNFGTNNNNHDVVIKFYEKEKGGKSS